MPNVGDVITGKLIGLPGNRYIWTQCPDCGTERWLRYRSYDPSSVRRCRQCHTNHARGRFKPHKAER
jgi:hypothetical protein